ncbi:MAG: murein hydrolase activator EnvC family protein [Myxococcota bacterium]
MKAVCLAGGLWAAAAFPQGVEAERAEVSRRLDAEKTALEALMRSQSGVLGALDAMERMTREGAARVGALERMAKRLAQQLSLAQSFDELTQVALEEQLRRLSPRLLGMYRLTRKDALAVLLSASDFATLIRRDRAVRALVAQDLALLARTQELRRFQRRSRAQLEWARASAEMTVAALQQEQAVAAQRKARFQEMLASIHAEAARQSRVIRELEMAEKELAALLAEMKSAATSGFRVLRGRLPYPVKGMIEAGFGKVVNPKFNTVTVRKGLDFRAPLGALVLAVAPGKVVFSDWMKGYGNLLILDHGEGYHTLMAHLAYASVEVGQEVARGQSVGAVGDTGSLKGAFLYFEIRRQGVAIDPGPWLNETVEP